MGGFASGRPRTLTGIVEQCFMIDANDLRRQGALSPAFLGRMTVPLQGGQAASIGIATNETAVVFTHPRWDSPGAAEARVPVLWKSCHLGGRRPYFVCPGRGGGDAASGRVGCGKPVTKLYWIGPSICCRRCARLCHASQRRSTLDRSLDRLNALRAKVGLPATQGCLDSYPGESCIPRPARMWRRTHERLQRRLQDAEDVERCETTKALA